MRATSTLQQGTDATAPFASLRISCHRALGLWWQARRDRRAGLPMLPQGDAVPAPTPFVRELDRHRLEVIEHERGRVLVATSELRVQLQTNTERIRQVEIKQASDHSDCAAAEMLALRLCELQKDRAALTEQIDRCAASAQHRALRFDEYMRRCTARYARTLVRHHPDGAILVARGWPVLGELPGWVLDPDPAVALFAPVRPDGGDR